MYGGSWAIVTGASGGIGLYIAHELAANNINIVFVARNNTRLDETAAVFREKYPQIATRVVSLDASNQDCNFDLIENAIKDIPVSLLFNNVGVHNDIPTNVEDMDRKEVSRIIAANCTFQVNFTALVIPHMKRYLVVRPPEQQENRPVIVNISSLTSRMAMPMLSLYAASKAFEEHFTVGLAAELQPMNIDCICMRPGVTVSAMSGESIPSLFCPSAQTMGRACVRMLNCGELSVVPYLPHALLDVINQWIPFSVSFPLVRDIHAKKRALKRSIAEKDIKKE